MLRHMKKNAAFPAIAVAIFMTTCTTDDNPLNNDSALVRRLRFTDKEKQDLVAFL